MLMNRGYLLFSCIIHIIGREISVFKGFKNEGTNGLDRESDKNLLKTN